MARNVELSWPPVDTSTEGDTGITGVEYDVQAKVQGAPEYTSLGVSPDTVRLIPNLEPGTWFFQVIAQHANYLSSDPVEVQGDIPFPKLSPVAEVTVKVM